jgi:hypothetical protein
LIEDGRHLRYPMTDHYHIRRDVGFLVRAD